LAKEGSMEDDEDLEKNTDLLRFNLYNSAFVVAQQGMVYPFELIKTRVQIRPSGGSELAAMAEVARGVIADRGVLRGLFHGFPWLVGPILFCEGLYYTTYVVMKKAMHDIAERYVTPQHREAVDLAIPFVAGGLAEACNTIVSVPTDILTQRLQILPREIEGSGPAVIRTVLAEQGVAGLFRGTTVTIVSYVPFSAVWLGTYEALKGIIACVGKREGSERAGSGAAAAAARAQHSPWREHLVHAWCGAVAATAATVVTNPIDVVKTRMQTLGAPSYLSVAAARQAQNGSAGGLAPMQQAPGYATALPQTQAALGQPSASLLRQRSVWYHMRYHMHMQKSFAAGSGGGPAQAAAAVMPLEALYGRPHTAGVAAPGTLRGGDTGVRERAAPPHTASLPLVSLDRGTLNPDWYGSGSRARARGCVCSCGRSA
jgi:hypothetical protein